MSRHVTDHAERKTSADEFRRSGALSPERAETPDGRTEALRRQPRGESQRLARYLNIERGKEA